MMTMTRVYPGAVSLSHVESKEKVCEIVSKYKFMLVDLDFRQLSTTRMKTFRGQEFTVKDQVTSHRVDVNIHIPLLLKDKEKQQNSLCRTVAKRYRIAEIACTDVAARLTKYAKKVHDDLGVDGEGKFIEIKGSWCLVLKSVCQERVLNMFESTCAICLDDLSARGECTRTACSHIFHDGCLNPWLDRQETCPVCRRKIHINS